MSNRRRSERFDIALPVWLKDGRGGDRTTTVDVSAHGIAVLATHGRPLRQYVELELELDSPKATITVTAVVARHAELTDRQTQGTIQGLGLDFFLFDAQAKTVWQDFIQNLRGRATPTKAGPPPPPQPELAAEDDIPTFIVKPRDLGRLWAFFRGEMARGIVRIESPVMKPVGHPAELLVVHPTSQAEWALQGHVNHATEHARGGRPVLDIALDALSAESKAGFRSFVATGHGQVEEDVAIPVDDELEETQLAPETPAPPVREDNGPERIESVVIDLDDFDDIEETLGSGLMEAPLLLAKAPPRDTPSGLFAQGPEPEVQEGDPTQQTQSRVPSGFIQEPSVPPRPALPEDPPLPAPDAEQDRPTSVFSSFFDEARQADSEPVDDAEPAANLEATSQDVGFDSPEITAEAEVDLSAASRARSEIQEPDEEPIPLVNRIPAKRRPPAEPRRAVPPLPPSARIRSAPPPPPPAPPSARMPVPPPQAQRAGPAGDPGVTVLEGRRVRKKSGVPRLASAPGLEVVQNPPVPPGSVFDFDEASQRDAAPAPKQDLSSPRAEVRWGVTPVQRSPAPTVDTSPKPQRNLRRAVKEQENAHHLMLSTESSDPELARNIALARARVVRSPHSVTACYRLSSLLVQDGESDGFKEAVQALAKVMSLEPNHPGAHHKLAELHARRGDYVKAAEHLSRARRLGYQTDPDLELIIGNANRE